MIFYVVMLITIAFPTLDMTVTTVLICISAAFMIFSFVMYLPIYKELKKTTKDKKKGLGMFPQSFFAYFSEILTDGQNNGGVQVTCVIKSLKLFLVLLVLLQEPVPGER